MTRAISGLIGVALCALIGTAAKAGAQAVCVGDCNGDGMVSIDELILGVNIALGAASIDECRALDADGDGMIGINELITAVGYALNGCPAPLTARVFTLFSEPLDSVPPGQTRLGIFTSILQANAAILFTPGPLTLLLGTPDANGIAPLTLQDDVTLTIATLGPCLCIKFIAAGSSGSLNCGGGTVPYDTQAERTSTNPNDLAFTVTTGLGNPAGFGNGNLLIQTQFEPVDTECAMTDCSTHDFTSSPQTFAFTTTNATAIQAQDPPNGPVTYTVPGEPFLCGNDFANPGIGMLAAPTPSSLLGFNVANVFRLSETKTK